MESRANIKDYLDSNIVYSGFIELWRDYDTYTDCLLTKVKIRGYKEPLSKSKSTDHIWIRYTHKDIPGIKLTRLTEIAGCGKVIRYKRKNGTYDYGVKVSAAVSINIYIKVRDYCFSNIQQLHNNNEVLSTKLLNKITAYTIVILYESIKWYLYLLKENVNYLFKEDYTYIQKLLEEDIKECNKILREYRNIDVIENAEDIDILLDNLSPSVNRKIDKVKKYIEDNIYYYLTYKQKRKKIKSKGFAS